MMPTIPVGSSAAAPSSEAIAICMFFASCDREVLFAAAVILLTTSLMGSMLLRLGGASGVGLGAVTVVTTSAGPDGAGVVDALALFVVTLTIEVNVSEVTGGKFLTDCAMFEFATSWEARLAACCNCAGVILV